eukprot:4676473-Lingulodinium_polyedra.AAC.1
MGRGEFRWQIIRAVRAGNFVPSSFLRVADRCLNAVHIWAERRELYQPMLVRFPKTAVRSDL